MIRTRVVFPLIWLRVSLINGIVECAQGVSLQCIPIDPNQSFIAEVNQNILRYPKNILKCAQGISLQYISMEPKQSFTRQWSEQKYLRDHLRVIKKNFWRPHRNYTNVANLMTIGQYLANWQGNAANNVLSISIAFWSIGPGCKGHTRAHNYKGQYDVI